MTRRRRAAGVVLLALIIVGIIWHLQARNQRLPLNQHEVVNPQSPAPPSQSATASAPTVDNNTTEDISTKRRGEAGVAAFTAPISFFGRVVDQFGQPVDNARVVYSVADNYFGKGSKTEGASDGNGEFAVSGLKGAGLYVEVSKDGYGRIPNQSYGSFGYGMQRQKVPPTKDRPAVFVLRKKLTPTQLVFVKSKQYELPRDGAVIGIDLRTGRKTDPNSASLQLSSITAAAAGPKARFDWTFRMSVPSGGIAETDGFSTSEAPEQAYQPSVEITMSATNDEWSDAVRKHYFVRCADGTYALIKIDVMLDPKFNFCALESYLNLNPGDRNLEFDPAIAIKAR
jgi:hypothetical protein